ncbi:transcriptional activator RfaH [Curvivirga aplysinae]|uniref:transcriptional activator RfaH n=1 Tax=Curvivirga aplysinae TaxID=2529852 RepID=UPI001C3FAA33|nr:transcriptional activator RfaH [Curvivirga aplysinae]
MHIEDTASTKNWIAVTTHTNSEELALTNIERQGFIGYCPKLLKTRRHARKTEEVKRPLFPGYIFVLIDTAHDQWRPIEYSKGVRSIVKFGNRLSYLPKGLMETIIERESSCGYILPETKNLDLKVGQKMRVTTDSVFEGIIGTILSVESKDRIWILLDLLNRKVKTEISASSLCKLN